MLEQFDHAFLVVACLGLYVFRVYAVGGVHIAVFFGKFPRVVEVLRVACHMDKGLGLLDIRVAVMGEACEQRAEGFASVALVGIDMAMRVNKHD